ncbi:MAG: 50S ribosomal protein L23 [Bacteroidota bacterium]|jgi:large subunit ribosomal protein L23|uniref:50S ribosomal protein L23 n=1 Tax=Candidatus Pollutiaquabacter sp. TaxID=3416354 RepID=UPI001A6249FE|nr:50S ribosomal protein L23 [Bacteroidota bacterium]MBL7948572.1 50S ribosomal protein L23 [Bacteroidia bacterium]MBP6009497.1 50S ribosomal protein L23 [Bacteroidia bacterium]MBP7268750.1 50S ribosomal protein L23 [Bacteroidia bacterium]MBP7437278.1 50S ribosomal protein L23 [Bacteroidia bacterium]
MSVLKKPLITEKMTKTSEKLGQYGFLVDRTANKIQIKQAVEKMYNVTVESVNTMVAPGKAKTRYTKTGVVSGSSGSFKKAVVTLKKGDAIDFYSNI